MRSSEPGLALTGSTAQSSPPAAANGAGSGQVLLFAAAVAIMVMNLFAVQTVAPSIARSLDLGKGSIGLLAMLPQLGYAMGLVLLVPLADRLENRRLIVSVIAVCALCMAAAAAAAGPAMFLLSVFLGGASSCAIQLLVPMLAFMTPPERRGAVVGNVMSGLLVGVLLSRPVANLLDAAWGWRAIYACFALAVGTLGLALWRLLPVRHPGPGPAYPALIASMAALAREEPVLRWRSLLAALGMAGYSVFWTAVSLLLSQPPFGIGPKGVALLALCGVAGALLAPWAGLAGDRGHTRRASFWAYIVVMLSWLLAGVAGAGWLGFDVAGHAALAVGLLTVAAIALDAAVTADQTLGRRAVNMIRPEARGRLNALFVGTFFVGSALGSAAAGAAWSLGGWSGVSALGVLIGAAMLLIFRASPRDMSAP
jgi:predicted MFS family arabinose efflux permease